MNNNKQTIGQDAQAVNFTFSFEPFFAALYLAMEQETNWEIRESMNRSLNTFQRLKDRGDVFHEELFEQIAHYLDPPLFRQDRQAWGIVIPESPFLCYGNASIYSLLMEEWQVQLSPGNFTDAINSIDDIRDLLFYQSLLTKFYGFDEREKVGLLMRKRGKEPDVKTSCKIKLDTRFLIILCNEELPAVEIDTIRKKGFTSSLLTYLRKALPLSVFQMKGLACIYVTGSTQVTQGLQ